MKFLILISLFAASLSATAVPLQYKIQNATVISSSPKNYTPTPPLRVVSAHVIVGKIWLAKQADGSYQEQEATVCDSPHVQVPVYNSVPGGGLKYDSSLALKCPATIKGGSVNVYAEPFMDVGTNVDLFQPGHTTNYKGFTLFTFVGDFVSAATPPSAGCSGSSTSTSAQCSSTLASTTFTFADATTEDTSLTTMILDSLIQRVSTDQPGDAVTGETFTVSVRFEDP